MKINDEGRSNAAYWHERAMKAEARLAEEESAHRVTAGIFASTLVRADAAEARLAEAERKIAGALRTAGGRWCEWGSRAESVRDILQGTTDSADVAQISTTAKGG